jgi:transposase
MLQHCDPEAKRLALQTSGTFNRRHDQVPHPLFQQSDFFDPCDLLQLKYETLRALKEEGYSIARAAVEFGLSRPTIYQAQGHFQKHGLEGLLPDKPGPKSPHKLTAEVRQHLRQLIQAEPKLGARELARRVRQRFHLKLHPRTIEKASKFEVKRGRRNPT